MVRVAMIAGKRMGPHGRTGPALLLFLLGWVFLGHGWVLWHLYSRGVTMLHDITSICKLGMLYKPIEQYKQCAFNLMMVDLEHHSYVCNRVVRTID
jgi:hypothetical protein